MLRAGARAVLETRTSRDELVGTADALIHGRCIASAAAMERLAEGPPQVPELTERQWEILRLLAESRSTADIAEKLYLTQSTVKTHIGRIAARVGLSGRQELEARAAQLLQTGRVIPETTPGSSVAPSG